MRKIDPLKTATLTCLLAVLWVPALAAQTTDSGCAPGTENSLDCDPHPLKLDAVDLLQDARALTTGSTKKALRKAKRDVEDSLADLLWADDSTLDSILGATVFTEEKKAADRLEELLGIEGCGSDADSDSGSDSDSDSGSDSDSDSEGADLDPEVEANVILALANLVLADDQLADGAIAAAEADLAMADCQAAGPGCDCAMADAEIETALRKLARARGKADAGKACKAIRKYERAWQHAQNALAAVSACPPAEITCPCEQFPLFAQFVNGTAEITGCLSDEDEEGAFAQTLLFTGARAEAGVVFDVEAECLAVDSPNFPDPLPPVFLPISEDEALFCIERLVGAVELCPCSNDPQSPLPDCSPPLP